MWTEWKDRLPFALVPLIVYSFGFSILRPTLILVLMDFLPKSRGLASSLQTFLQTFLFAMVSALVVPLIYGNASGYLAGLIVCGCLGFAVWQIAVFRVPVRACR
jgi:DHA1 family bicyclomycin/chloramphenicol resistance-like MFS transporter